MRSLQHLAETLIKLVHHAFTSGQLLQRPQEFSLLTALPELATWIIRSQNRGKNSGRRPALCQHGERAVFLISSCLQLLASQTGKGDKAFCSQAPCFWTDVPLSQYKPTQGNHQETIL